MGPEPKRGAGPQRAGPPDNSDNKYAQVIASARARKRRRGNLDDDYQRPLYEPARPPAPEEPR